MTWLEYHRPLALHNRFLCFGPLKSAPEVKTRFEISGKRRAVSTLLLSSKARPTIQISAKGTRIPRIASRIAFGSSSNKRKPATKIEFAKPYCGGHFKEFSGRLV